MNKIFIYKIDGNYIAVIATCAYAAREGLIQKFGPTAPKHYVGVCDDVLQVNGMVMHELAPDDVKIISEEYESLIENFSTNQKEPQA